ncbi:MAG: hypothetical protein ACREGG_01565 [Candidatus Saccharimonadales bacterium]
MTEHRKDSPRAKSELLNTPEESLLATTPGIGWQRYELEGYVGRTKTENPELAKHAGSWVFLIRKYMRPAYGILASEQAESAYNAGNIMTYELLRRIAEKKSQTVPDPPFLADSIVDTELPPHQGVRLIDLSHRGVYLPEKHPALFMAAVDMFSRIYSEDPGELQAAFFESAYYDAISFDAAHFLFGAAEVILPIERHAQVMALENQL